MSVRQPTLIFTGGGTGGHVFPMVAVAKAVARLNPAVRVVFVGTARGIETKIVPQNGYQLELLTTTPATGEGLLGLARGGTQALANLPEARGVLARYRPLAVLSLGGYAAVSLSLVARLGGIKVALIEPNSVIGLANRLMAPWAQRAYTAFDGVSRHFRASAVRCTGLALRPDFLPVPYRYAGGALKVLVLGGSQGAQQLNDLVPPALARAKVKVHVVHQAGHGKELAVRERYQRLGAGAVARVESFLDDMPAQLGRADLVLARSGAGAIAEISAVGRPCLLIPYPHATADHQRHNALALERAGAAKVLDSRQLDVDSLVNELNALTPDSERLTRMAECARRFGRPGAALEIAQDLLTLAGIAFEAPIEPARGTS